MAQNGLEPAKSHSLPSELIVSLTSYPRRFSTLHLTLQCLLRQTVVPDRIILWLSAYDKCDLPRKVIRLAQLNAHLEIREVADIKSYKKFIFAVSEFPHSFIATADDDLYYDPSWLQHLVEGYDPLRPLLPALRVHRVPPLLGGELPGYMSWEQDVQDGLARAGGADLLATCGAGALFAPGSVHPEIGRSDIFMELCPTGDDLWLYWMVRKAGWSYRKVGPQFELKSWPGTHDDRLFALNKSANDLYLKRLIQQFGDAADF